MYIGLQVRGRSHTYLASPPDDATIAGEIYYRLDRVWKWVYLRNVEKWIKSNYGR